MIKHLVRIQTTAATLLGIILLFAGLYPYLVFLRRGEPPTIELPGEVHRLPLSLGILFLAVALVVACAQIARKSDSAPRSRSSALGLLVPLWLAVFFVFATGLRYTFAHLIARALMSQTGGTNVAPRFRLADEYMTLYAILAAILACGAIAALIEIARRRQWVFFPPVSGRMAVFATTILVILLGGGMELWLPLPKDTTAMAMPVPTVGATTNNTVVHPIELVFFHTGETTPTVIASSGVGSSVGSSLTFSCDDPVDKCSCTLTYQGSVEEGGRSVDKYLVSQSLSDGKQTTVTSREFSYWGVEAVIFNENGGKLIARPPAKILPPNSSKVTGGW